MVLRGCDDDERRVCVPTCAVYFFVVLAYVRCGALHYVDIGLVNEKKW